DRLEWMRLALLLRPSRIRGDTLSISLLLLMRYPSRGETSSVEKLAIDEEQPQYPSGNRRGPCARPRGDPGLRRRRAGDDADRGGEAHRSEPGDRAPLAPHAEAPGLCREQWAPLRAALEGAVAGRGVPELDQRARPGRRASPGSGRGLPRRHLAGGAGRDRG